MYRRTFADGRIIEFTAIARQQHHWKFQAFGFVNRHNANRIFVLTHHFDLTHADLAFLDCIDIFHKAVQRSVLTALICVCLIDQRAQIRLSAAAGRHRAHGDIEAGFQKQLPDQLIQRQQHRKLRPDPQTLQYARALFSKCGIYHAARAFARAADVCRLPGISCVSGDICLRTTVRARGIARH